MFSPQKEKGNSEVMLMLISLIMLSVYVDQNMLNTLNTKRLCQLDFKAGKSLGYL